MDTKQLYPMALMSVAHHLVDDLYTKTPKTPSVEESAHAVKFHINAAGNLWHKNPMLPIDTYFELDNMRTALLKDIKAMCITPTDRVNVVTAMMFQEIVGMPEPQKTAFNNLAKSIKTMLEVTNFVNELE